MPPPKSHPINDATKIHAEMTNSPADAVKGNDRFSKVALDPRFKKIRRKETKINVDPRFKKMFTQKEFQTTAKYDKYGRKLAENTKSHGKKELERFYHLASSSDQEEASECEKISSEDESSSSSDENALTFSEGEEVCLEHPLAQDQSEIPHGNRTKRLALTNLDWDFIKAQDLFKLFDSFKPSTAAFAQESSSLLLNIKIYKSQFGKERMELENKSGPALEILPFSQEQTVNSLSNVAASSAEEEPMESESSQRACQIALKRYKLEKLRYFFAVVECASVEYASLLYDKCDGIEFEKSSNFLDLRFVPDELTFEEEDLHEEFHFSNACSSSSSYCPKDFSSSASSLQCTTQKLAWDEDDVLRSRITKRNISKDQEILEEDYAAFVASCSSSDDDDEDEHESGGEGRISKYRSILADSDALNRGNPFQKDKNKWQEMEVVFDSGTLESVAVGGLLEESASKQSSEQIVQETPFEKQLRKGRERRLESKQKAKERAQEFASSSKEMQQPELSPEQLAILCSNSAAAAQWEKEEKNVTWKPNVSDERFSAILESADYALDPTHPAFKSTECNLELMKRKRKKANRQ